MLQVIYFISYASPLQKFELMQIFILWREISDIAKVLWKSLSHKTCPTVCWKEIKLVHISVSDTIYFYNTVYTIRLTGISLALINSSQEFHWGTKSLDCSANMKDCNFSLLQRIFLRKFRNNVNHGRQWTPISLELWNTLYVGKKEKKRMGFETRSTTEKYRI